MVIVSNSKTASEMLDEVVNELRKRVEDAKKAAAVTLAFRKGYVAALVGELDFWQQVVCR